MSSLTPFEISIREALALAQAARKQAGLAPTDLKPRRQRDGSRVVGPRHYQLTMYLKPWHYADLVYYQRKNNLTIGLGKIVEKLIEDHIDHVANRPAEVARPTTRPAAPKLRALNSRDTKAKAPSRRLSPYQKALAALDQKAG